MATFADNMGTVTQNTANFRVQSVAFAGGAATATVTDANMQAGHSVFCQISTSANPVSIQKVTEGVGSFVVLMSADPGATTFKYMIVKNQ